MKKVKLFIIGFIIGVGKIIPGVSGAIFAILFGVYEDIIECISNPLKIGKKLSKIVPLGIGIVFAIIFGSNMIKILLKNCYVESMFFFIGMMSFGLFPLLIEVKSLKKKKTEYIVLISVILFLSSFFFIDFQGSGIVNHTGLRAFISLFLCGLIDAASAVIPGISGTAILLILGYYERIISNLAGLGSVDTFMSSFITLLPFLIGMAIGLIIISKLVNYLFKNYESIVKISIIGFTCVSILILLSDVIFLVSSSNIIYDIILYILGFIISYLIECKLCP